MSKRWLRHFVAATICTLVPLISVGPVQASPPTVSTRASAIPESAVLRKFRDTGPPVMLQASQLEAGAVSGMSTVTTFRSVPLAAPTNPRLFGEVFGFAFASSLGDQTIGYPSWNFALLSTVAYFGVHVSWTGDFSNDSALTTWNNPNGPVPGFINTAHAYGTKVVLTLIMFDSTGGTPNMCSALQPARAALTIQNTVNQVLAKGIDGVNVDYESNNTTCYDGNGGSASSQSLFTAFVKNLRAALPTGSYISVDTYSGAAGYRDASGAFLGFYDIGALANYADSFFVMAYDMEYANWDSPPLSCLSFCIGPTAPLSTYLFNDGRASSEYRAVVPASKVIMGIPYYGRKECVDGYTPSNAPPNVGGSGVAADGYLDASTENGYFANSDYHMHRETRDPLSATRWDTFFSSTYSCTREMYWDDVPALSNKYDLVIHDRLRGIGIFALNYGGGAPELWGLINLKFGQCSEAAIAASLSSPQIPGTSITFTGSALCAGTAQYEFQVQPQGGAWSYIQSYGTQSVATWNTTTATPYGTYQFEVDARNLGSSVSYDTYADMSMRLARCVTPVITPDHSSPQLPGTAITLTASVTCNGTPEYQFSMQPPGGALSVVQPYGSAATLNWNTTGLAYGTYNFSVNVRVAGTTVSAESTQTMTYSLTSCNATALVTDKTSPQPTGTHVTLTGSATCAGAPQYRFMIQPPGGAWSIAQDFGSGATFAWNGGGAGGTYGLEVDAKGAGTATSSMDSKQLSFALTSCSAVTLTSSLNTPQVPGASIVLTGAATCPGAAQYRFAIQKPNAAYVIAQDYGSATTYTWSTTGLALGDYGLKVDVRNAGATTASEASASVVFTLANPACTAPAVTTDRASPQGAGTVITFSATTTTCPSPLFRFLVQTPDLTWTIMQDYSTAKTWKWQPPGPAGNYRIEIDARDSTRPVQWDQYTVVPYVINACSGGAMTDSVPSPQASGTLVVLTGSAGASFCPNPLYEFWVLAPGSSTWAIAQAFSTSATFSWDTTGRPSGAYHLGVWVRDAGSAGTVTTTLGNFDTFASAVYTLNTQPCASVAGSAAPALTSTTGTAVTITGNASGCPNPRYEFWILPPGSSTWTIAQAYSSSATYSWNTNGLTIGTYHFSVWVRDTSSLGTSCNSLGCNDTFAAVSYTLTSRNCASVTASAAPASPVTPGTAVNFTGVASGCPNPLYQFWILAPGASTWSVAQSYSAGATLSWNTTGLPAGVYRFGVWVRDASSAGTSCNSLGCNDAFVATTFTLAPVTCTSVTASATPASPSPAGTAVTFTAEAAGCPNPLYQFWILIPGSSTWTKEQAYSASPTFNWSTAGPLPAGTYRFSVWVRDASSAGAISTSLGALDAFVGISYTLTSTPCASVTASAAPASPSAHGTTITFTGVASGCPNALYEFWILAPGSSTWVLAQAYSTSATFNWNTTGLPAGVYRFSAWVHDSSSAGAVNTSLGNFDAFVGIAYTLT
jgi:spore germination protein YaaH